MRWARRSADGPTALAGEPRSGVETPADLPRGAWKGIGRRAVRGFREDQATSWAAALTYYGIQSIFPALLVLVALVGLAGHGTRDSLIQNLHDLAPGPTRDVVESGIRNLEDSRGSAGTLLVIGLLGALWSSSGYVAAFTNAANRIWNVEEGRPFYKLRPMQLGVTFVMLVLLAVSAGAVILTGGLARHVGDLVGVGSTAVQVWDIAKWPVLAGVVTVMLAVLYWAAPNTQQPGFRWITPGGIVAVLLWIVVSAGFALYVANFGSYNATYGSLGAVITFLIWLWLSNLAVLFGAELNAEIVRARQMAAGQPEDVEPITPPRDDPADNGHHDDAEHRDVVVQR